MLNIIRLSVKMMSVMVPKKHTIYTGNKQINLGFPLQYSMLGYLSKLNNCLSF